MMMSKSLTKATAGSAVATYDYGQQSHEGFEGTTGADLSVPFISILQSNSPQIEERDPPGAESGMLFNTVTRELTEGSKGVVFLPCHKEVAFVEWVPRSKGGGFVGLYSPDSVEVSQAIELNNGVRVGRLQIGDNELIETHYVYGLVLDEGGTTTQGFAVVSFTSTKIKPFKDWMTAMYTLKGKPPLYANRAKIRTVKQKNEHGTFFNFRIDPLNDNWIASLIDPVKSEELLKEALEFRKMVVNGMARAAFETQEAASGGASASEDGAPPF